ncbi:hypothetical protein C2S51_015914 [Perilla frutescens var. frutescens]|nr:hypothetical protein C2S51_015914 [Perilla frutescens var. frutescens]
MEKEFQFQNPLLVGGEASTASMDEAYFTGICAGLSFRSLLTGGSFEPPSESGDPLKTLKTESLFPISDGTAVETPMYNFFSEPRSSSVRHHLPGLRSFELASQNANADSPVPNPRIKAGPYSKLRRQRRREPYRLSDKTRCLRKLLPSDEKMNIATVLEEAYRYIKFLQAQVSALQSMPCQTTAAGGGGAATNIVGGDLGRLTRQQLLQVVTNSPAVQAQLCADSCCVFSVEQLLSMEKRAEREALVQETCDSSNPNSFHA